MKGAGEGGGGGRECGLSFDGWRENVKEFKRLAIIKWKFFLLVFDGLLNE